IINSKNNGKKKVRNRPGSEIRGRVAGDASRKWTKAMETLVARHYHAGEKWTEDMEILDLRPIRRGGFRSALKRATMAAGERRGRDEEAATAKEGRGRDEEAAMVGEGRLMDEEAATALRRMTKGERG
ncbi:hypothetical protein ACLOJK_038198, partial [Asimina triloba]